MNIALIGHGRMGREVEARALEQGDRVVAVFEIDNPVSAGALADADVCIEFSAPDAVLDNIRTAVTARKDIVVGTTGWHGHLEEVRQLVRQSGLIYSANFSLGMNVFLRLAARAAEMMNGATDYDVSVHEVHHRQKADSPSGTALDLARVVIERLDRKTGIMAEKPEGRVDPALIHVSSTRIGTVAGTHAVTFDSESDSIELRHAAKNRRGFALGALAAARWIRGRKGVYTMDDVPL